MWFLRLFLILLLFGLIGCNADNGKVRIKKNAQELHLLSELNVDDAKLIYKSNLPSGVKANVQVESENGLLENFYHQKFDHSGELIVDLKRRSSGFSCGKNDITLELIRTDFQEKHISRKVGAGFSRFKGGLFKGDDIRRIAMLSSNFDLYPPFKCLNLEETTKALKQRKTDMIESDSAKEAKKKCEALCRRSSSGGYRNYENCVFTCKNRL